MFENEKSDILSNADMYQAKTQKICTTPRSLKIPGALTDGFPGAHSAEQQYSREGANSCMSPLVHDTNAKGKKDGAVRGVVLYSFQGRNARTINVRDRKSGSVAG